MAILSTTINGTHVNATEAEVSFQTTVLTDGSRAMSVHITTIRDGVPVNHSDYVLSPQQTTHSVLAGDGIISLSGQLTLDFKNRAIVFDGSLNYQNHVRLSMGPVVVAVL